MCTVRVRESERAKGGGEEGRERGWELEKLRVWLNSHCTVRFEFPLTYLHIPGMRLWNKKSKKPRLLNVSSHYFQDIFSYICFASCLPLDFGARTHDVADITHAPPHLGLPFSLGVWHLPFPTPPASGWLMWTRREVINVTQRLKLSSSLLPVLLEDTYWETSTTRWHPNGSLTHWTCKGIFVSKKCYIYYLLL